MNYVFFRRMRHQLSKSFLRKPLIWFHHRSLSKKHVLIASYPRSGSTWLRFMLKEIITGESAQFDTINKFIPYIGKHYRAPLLLPDNTCLIKTHEQFRKEYKQAIYLVRDVRDVLNSEYSYQQWRGVYNSSLENFLVSFLNGTVNGYGSWQEHVDSWLNASTNKSNKILVITYEDLCSNTEKVLKKILDFLGCKVEEGVIHQAIQNNTVDHMRKKEVVARNTIHRKYRQDINFIRNGAPGNWRKELSIEQINLLEKHAHHILVCLGYTEFN